ncbi:hypothetical protein [Marinomonas ostreistagni]|uniref:Uncharacterized protein n=1 Tax=Marinomonas ostreistagni TaxID=359209 RepID=A0ABS0ZDF3_9GAMM|nr:hypothetical protein [Marinomonas ostreistagni]MBJ7551681.1 hypothetical protein [Marinomonas ostreistagni]
MKKPDIVMYCNVMEEIKRRTSVIDFFHNGTGHALYEPTTLESIALQVRKILELIAMASLVANKKEYEKVYSNFANAWNAEYLLKDLERVNADFYPKPVVEAPSDDPKVKNHLVDRDEDYLTKKEFIKVYKKCGAIMHASNPLGRKIGYEYYKKSIPEWRQKIINLLNNHQIRLLGHDGFYLIHMKEDRDDKVHFYEFALAGQTDS